VTGQARPSRRLVFQGLGALGVAAALAGCGADDPVADTGDTGPAPTSDAPTTESASEPPSSSPGSPGDGPADGAVLARTDEVPVGGGIVLFTERIVITQPERGRFEAFSAVCKHQGETVSTVADGTITCTVHGSQYDAATGDVTRGPAAAGLDPIRIRVAKGAIRRA